MSIHVLPLYLYQVKREELRFVILNVEAFVAERGRPQVSFTYNH